MSLQPTLDSNLSNGAHRCLILLRSLAGHARMFSTLTCSLATQMGRCVNTIRNYRDHLVDAGYIWWTTDKRSGITTIMIRASVEPPSRQARLAEESQAAAWPRLPQPAAWRGAQKTVSIKSSGFPTCTATLVDKFSWQKNNGPRDALRTVAEQLAAIGH